MAISKEKVREQLELILKDAVPMLLEKADALLNDKEMINFGQQPLPKGRGLSMSN